MPRNAQRKKVSPKKPDMFLRFMFVVAILVLWIGGIGARLVHLQVNQHAWLKEKAQGQRQNLKRSKAPRGTIYDRNGRTLAISVTVNTLYADATRIDDVQETAKKLSSVVGMREKDLRVKLTEAKQLERKFVPLIKGIDTDEFDRINKELEDLKVKKGDLPRYQGLHWREEQQRSFPNGQLAAHILGFSNAEGIGQAGIEQSQNDVLYGAVIKKVQQRDRLGRVYDEAVTEKEPAKDIVLTISNSIQFKTEQALEKAVKETGSRSAIAVVIENATGEVLALANYPTFDPNNITAKTKDNIKNAAVQNIYSPGSVFKLITYGAAMEKGMISSPDAMIDGGNGVIRVANRQFKDSRALGSVTYKKAMAVSSNVCAIKTGMRIGRESFHASILDFGFGKVTGIELPGEISGIVRPVERWNGDSLASMSIGYEIGVTALQMTSAFATIANDGIRVQPRMIREVRSSEGVHRPQAVANTRVVSSETARGLREMLREVVVSGTGKSAQLDGFTSAGKTGTAWKFDEKLKRVNSAKYVSSFIGFAPADDPKVTIAVIMDEPKLGGRGGGAAAAPAFKEIAEGVLPELNILPGATEQQLPLMTRPELLAQNDLEEIPESVGDGVDIESSTSSIFVEEMPSKPVIKPGADNRIEPKTENIDRKNKDTENKREPQNNKQHKKAERSSAVTRKRIETNDRN